jgi:hypothetical protein
VSFAAITLCVTSQRVILKVSVYFVIDSVRNLLDTPSYSMKGVDEKYLQNFSLKTLREESARGI